MLPSRVTVPVQTDPGLLVLSEKRGWMIESEVGGGGEGGPQVPQGAGGGPGERREWVPGCPLGPTLPKPEPRVAGLPAGWTGCPRHHLESIRGCC